MTIYNLGRRLIKSEPQSDGSKLDHSEEGRREFVVACRDASEVFDFVEETLDQVAVTIEDFAETAFPSSVGFTWNIGCRSLILDVSAEVVCIVCFVAKDNLTGLQSCEQGFCRDAVMHLACGDGQTHRQPFLVSDGVYFGCQASSTTPHTSI